MAPQFVKPYVKDSKTDAADAEAICEAVSRPNMRFVPLKQAEQQALLAVHRAWAGFVKACTAQANQLRGLLAEFGVVMPQDLAALRLRLPVILAQAEHALPDMRRQLVARLAEHLKLLDQQVAELEKQIQLWHRQCEASQRLAAIPRIGPITATALVANIGDARAFRDGRQLAAGWGWCQDSTQAVVSRFSSALGSGGYLRTLFIHGTREVIGHIKHRNDQVGSWLQWLLSRRHHNTSAVALANKNARIVWALLVHDREYQAENGSSTLAA